MGRPKETISKVLDPEPFPEDGEALPGDILEPHPKQDKATIELNPYAKATLKDGKVGGEIGITGKGTF